MSSKAIKPSRYDFLEELAASSASGIKPPERINVAEAAEKYRYLNNPGSYVGYWDNTFAPYLVEPMEVLTSMDHTEMIFAGPARTGKSDMFFNWLTHTAICDPADMMAVHMTMNVARDWSQKDLRRAFRHTKELGRTLAPGRSNQSTHDVRFLSGMHLLVKWPTITELSGKTVGRNWIADYDRIAPSIDGEGSAFSLTAKRAETFRRHGMTVAESSPGFDIQDPKWRPSSEHEAPPVGGGVLQLYNQGDRRRWYWRCPHCARPFEPDFKLFQIPDSEDPVEAAENTVMGCPHCGGVIRHEAADGVPGKHEMNQLGNARWVREGEIWVPRSRDGSVAEHFEGKCRRSDRASFWLKGPAAQFADWRGIVLRYRQAKQAFDRTGDQEALRVTVNTDQGLPYLPKGLEGGRSAEDVRSKAVEIGEHFVPPKGRFLVATIDVQKYRFEVQVHAVLPGNDFCVIDRFAIRKSLRLDDDGVPESVKPATYLEDWDLLIEKVFMRAYPLPDGSGREMEIRMIGCDSGGSSSRGNRKSSADRNNDSSVTKNAYEFYRRLRNSQGEDGDPPPGLHRRFLLLKGGSTKEAPRVKISYPDSERSDRRAGARGEIPVLILNTLKLKDQLDSMMERSTPGGGCITFANWLPDTFWDEMVAEVREGDGWVKVATRNEAWDLLVYLLAVTLYRPILLERLDWSAPPEWAEEWDENTMVFDIEGRVVKEAKVEKKGMSLEELGSVLG